MTSWHGVVLSTGNQRVGRWVHVPRLCTPRRVGCCATPRPVLFGADLSRVACLGHHARLCGTSRLWRDGDSWPRYQRVWRRLCLSVLRKLARRGCFCARLRCGSKTRGAALRKKEGAAVAEPLPTVGWPVFLCRKIPERLQWAGLMPPLSPLLLAVLVSSDFSRTAMALSQEVQDAMRLRVVKSAFNHSASNGVQ